MKEKPATTKDITRHIVPVVEELAEAVGLVARAVAKHSQDPPALIGDLMLLSEPDKDNNPITALFWQRFNLVMRGGIKPTEH